MVVCMVTFCLCVICSFEKGRRDRVARNPMDHHRVRKKKKKEAELLFSQTREPSRKKSDNEFMSFENLYAYLFLLLDFNADLELVAVTADYNVKLTLSSPNRASPIAPISFHNHIRKISFVLFTRFKHFQSENVIARV